MKKLLILIGLLSLSAIVLAQITTPIRINYQGVLRDSTGAPLDGDVTLIFRFYDDPTSGNLLWEETYNELGYPPEITVTNGLFSIALGDPSHRSSGIETDFENVFNYHTDVYLAVQVDTDPEMTPRIKVISAPYSLNADNFDGQDSSHFLNTSSTAQTKMGLLTLSGGLDLGPGANDDLTASYVITLTSGGVADTLHGHTNVSGSDTLDGLDSTQFLRSDVSDTFTGGKLSIDTGSVLQIPDGSPGAPGLAFTDDPDTGIFRTGIDQLAFATSGTSHFVLDDTGNIAFAGALQSGCTTPSVFNRFGCVTSPESGFISDTTDAFVSSALEVGGLLALSKNIYLEGSSNPGGDGNQYIYFYNNDSRTNEYIRWDDAEDHFEISDGLNIRYSIRVGTTGSPTAYNHFGSGGTPDSNDMTATNDVYIYQDLEVGAAVYLSKTLFLEGSNAAGADGNQYIYFYNNDSRTSEYLRWDDSDETFAFSDSINISGALRTGTVTSSTAYNHFGSSGTPVTTDMGNAGDVFIENDLELGQSLYLPYGTEAAPAARFAGDTDTGMYRDPGGGLSFSTAGTRALLLATNGAGRFSGTLSTEGPNIYLNTDGPDQIAGIYFYDQGSNINEHYRWDDAQNRFNISNTLNIEGDLSTDGDVDVGQSVSIGVNASLGGVIWMDGTTMYLNSDGPDTDVSLFIYDDGSNLNEYIRWQDTNDRFYISDDLYVGGNLTCSGTKPFIQNHPERLDMSVIYTALEGDEAGTYTRGSALLEQGEAQVSLGETYKWVTNPDVGLTAHLTPRGECSDLYVRSLTTETLTVAQTDGKQDTCPFDYIVYGLRIGYEQNSVLAHRSIESNVPSSEYWQQYYSTNTEFQRYNPLSRFQKMQFQVHGKQADESNATRALRSGIGEFDPNNDVLDTNENGLGESEPAVETHSMDYESTDPRKQDNTSVLHQSNTSFHAKSASLSGTFITYDSVENGAVLVMDPTADDAVRLCDTEADPLVVGIVSNTVQGGASTDGHTVSVTFQGIALCKVDATYGSIQKGDLLVTSPTPGFAMQGNEAQRGTIIGKALRSLESGTGLVKVMIMVR